ncbi:hypothetical protein JKI95_07025 [Corynebacterium aquatimens]|uniref:flavodoxin domain-containing protein n=1 Tax=Corynebacterium aquatimens TaxID=1190508 RepID=UPI00254249A4|nr:flavodoxin domain-containing protein [Corynebacterium aquatimens]QYH19040.1 hypothetical protein JKI95_07025 [Corynebacterium aquatimens]
MSCEIYYSTYYGSTKRYAEELGVRLGVSVDTLPQPQHVSAAPEAGPLVVLAPAHGPLNDGAKFLQQLPADVLANRPACLVTVGMTLDDEVVRADPAASLLGQLKDTVQRFYLPGRLNYPELSSAHKNVMRGLIGMLKLKPGKTENERNMVATYGKDVDRVDLARLDLVEAWAREHGA